MVSRAIAKPLKMIIISRAECHFCQVVSRMAHSLQQEFPLEVVTLSVDDDHERLALYGNRVPVVLIDGIERCAGKFTEGDLRRAVLKARWRKPISRILFCLGYAPNQR